MFIMRVYEYKFVYDQGINYANWKKRKKTRNTQKIFFHFFLCIYMPMRVLENLQREFYIYI